MECTHIWNQVPYKLRHFYISAPACHPCKASAPHTCDWEGKGEGGEGRGEGRGAEEGGGRMSARMADGGWGREKGLLTQGIDRQVSQAFVEFAHMITYGWERVRA